MMHRISHILESYYDYKICLECGRVNWYENEDCVDCGSTKFREATEDDILELINAYKESGHYCHDCEIEV